jgi:hypothetical protein
LREREREREFGESYNTKNLVVAGDDSCKKKVEYVGNEQSHTQNNKQSHTHTHTLPPLTLSLSHTNVLLLLPHR